jgi:dihydrofolate reductase
VKLIVATDEKNGIGLNGDIPWKGIHSDFPFFKSMTSGSNVIMGRKTYESIGSKPLKGRVNWVVSSTKSNSKEIAVLSGDELISSLEDEYSLVNIGFNDDWVIGGSSIYDLCMPYVTEMFITQVPGDWKCDTFFNMPANFSLAGSFLLDGKLKVRRYLI